jgi:hypothetical protein
MTAFYVTRGQDNEHDNVHYPQRMALHIAREGRQRRDIVSELLKHLRFRYELQERVFSHHAKTAADAMLGKLFAFWRDAEWLERARCFDSPAVRSALTDPFVSVDDIREILADNHETAAPRLDAEVVDHIEGRMRVLGDDGLLEMLADLGAGASQAPEATATGASAPPRACASASAEPPMTFDARSACRQLAKDLLDRRFFKRAAEAKDASAHAKLFNLFGEARPRRALERDAAHYADHKDLPIGEADVIVWVPEPRMRMKIAEVLVDYGSGIAPYSEHSGRGSDIYESHRQLWNITVYLHPRLRGTEAERKVLVRLAQTMGVEWDRHRPLVADKPTLWPLDLAARWPVGIELEQELRDVLREAEATSFRGSDTTFEETQKDWETQHDQYQKNHPKDEPELSAGETEPDDPDADPDGSGDAPDDA